MSTAPFVLLLNSLISGFPESLMKGGQLICSSLGHMTQV
jgi:hypothetical protein